MLLVRIITYIKGFVRISVAGRFTERFLNICMNRNIYVWDIKPHDKETMHLNMTIKGFKKIPPIAYKSRTRVHVISRHGLPFFVNKYKKRKVFLISGTVAIALLVYITSFVWVIDVEGNEKVKTETIIEALEENGFKTGIIRYGNDISTLQNKMMLSIDELSWFWVEIKGTRAIVKVKEKTPIPQIVDRHIPCNIVASNSGVITEINATYGEKLAKIGDVVKKGDLLIGGISNTKYDGIHYLHSSGVVKARTYHKKASDYPLVKEVFSKTGKKISKKTINFFGFRVKLYSRENSPYEYSEKEERKRYVTLGKNYVLPVGVESIDYYELDRSELPLTLDQVTETGKNELSLFLDENLPEGTVVVNKTHSAKNVDEKTVRVEVSYECIEQIGVEVPIEIN